MSIKHNTSTNISKLILQFLSSFTLLAVITALGLLFLRDATLSIPELLKQAIFFASITSLVLMSFSLVVWGLSSPLPTLSSVHLFNLKFSRLKCLTLILFSSIYLLYIDQNSISATIQNNTLTAQQDTNDTIINPLDSQSSVPLENKQKPSPRQSENGIPEEQQTPQTVQTEEVQEVITVEEALDDALQNSNMAKLMNIDLSALKKQQQTSLPAEPAELPQEKSGEVALFTALRDGNWDDINVAEASELDATVLELGLVIGMLETAPTSFIDKILASGTALDNKYRHAIFSNGNLPYLKALLDRGMTLDGYDATGHTSLTSNLSTLDSDHKKDMFNFLISQGLNTNIAAQDGQTPMDYALQQYDGENAAHYIQTLIKNNASITPENLLQIQTIKLEQPDIYNNLISKVPELNINALN